MLKPNLDSALGWQPERLALGKHHLDALQDYFKKSPSQQAIDYGSEAYNAAGSKAQGAYDSAKGAASDASSRAQRNAKGTQQAAAGKAGQAYDAAADSANRASGKAGTSTGGGLST